MHMHAFASGIEATNVAHAPKMEFFGHNAVQLEMCQVHDGTIAGEMNFMNSVLEQHSLAGRCIQAPRFHDERHARSACPQWWRVVRKILKFLVHPDDGAIRAAVQAGQFANLGEIYANTSHHAQGDNIPAM